MPPEGMDRRDYLEAKFGGKDGAVKAYLPVMERAEAAGLKINFEAIARTPNTLDAHRLIHWAGIEDRQMPVAMALFRAGLASEIVTLAFGAVIVGLALAAALAFAVVGVATVFVEPAWGITSFVIALLVGLTPSFRR